MSDHYFSQTPQSEHDIKEFEAVLRGKPYIFQTDAGVFSRTKVDKGSLLLINNLLCEPGETVLNLS